MAKSFSPSMSKLFNPISQTLPTPTAHNRRVSFRVCAAAGPSPPSNKYIVAATETEFRSQQVKRNMRRDPRSRRRLIKISTTDGRWHGEWICDYVFSLRELQLADLVEDGQKDARVFISLTIQKHASFGFSVNGRIVTSLHRKCSCCSSSYCREIDTTFDVWVLPTGKNDEPSLPEIGGTDPSVIYVKPGSEADLDSLIQDSIRLIASTKDTCSETCEKSAIIWQYNDEKRVYDQRWSRLLEIKKRL